MITRKDYLDAKASHDDYYAQFVTPSVIALVGSYIGFHVVRTSQDPHFNDIPLKNWDAMAPALWNLVPSQALKDAGEIRSLGTAVCILKAAARIIKEGVQ